MPKGSSEAPVEVATKDDVYTEGTEEFDIALNAVTAGKDQFENVTVDDTAVTTSITDESDPYNPKRSRYTK
ncbi:immunoglobulin-like domain-containing protein [Arcobacter roscoffensis]|uniref:immunoglobulin-like domain-containing protein n=1 Tax=Arcobacter roscoffensis TaxID=2961520 RepID=UPI003D225412